MLSINDLPQTKALDAASMSAIRGGCDYHDHGGKGGKGRRDVTKIVLKDFQNSGNFQFGGSGNVAIGGEGSTNNVNF